MKRATNEATRHGLRRFAAPFIGGMMMLGLAGCSGGMGGFDLGLSSSDSEQQAAEQQPQQQKTKPIAFAPVIGAPSAVSKKLNDMLVANAGQKAMPVVATKEADYTIRGYLVAQPDPKGTKLSYIWDISDKAGKRAKRFQGDELIEGKKGGDPWSAVDEAAMQRIAGKTTDDLLTWLPKADAPGAPAAPAAVANGKPGGQTNSATASVGTAPAPAAKPAAPTTQTASSTEPSAARAPRPVTPKVNDTVLASAQPAGPVVAVVSPVTGAPGDGVMSLTDAMRRHLTQAGVTLGEGGDSNAYVVHGSVELGQIADGQQPIVIRWQVVGPDGKTIEKTVVQRNKVPEGSLDGSWGQVADLAAGEAAKSVAKLLGKSAG